MNDILNKKSNVWGIRLKKCMDEGGYTQTSFAKALNDKYKTCYGQKDVSRWLNVGTKIKNGEIGFPKYSTMLLIADCLGVDVGYLTGETNDESFSLEKACSYMGLSGAAIKSIREITHPDMEAGHMRIDMREALNRFLTANGFTNFFDSLFSLYETSIYPKRIANHEFENLDSAIDYMREVEFTGKIERYELNETLILLINEIYPNPFLSNSSDSNKILKIKDLTDSSIQ